MPRRNGRVVPGHPPSFYLLRNHERERQQWRDIRRILPTHPPDSVLCDVWLCIAVASYSAFRGETLPDRPNGIDGFARTILNLCAYCASRIFVAPREGCWHVYPIDDESRHLASSA